METLWRLYIEKSGIRELPSIAYFPELRHLDAGDCDLQNIQLRAFGKKVKFDEVSSCSSNLQLALNLGGCNLSDSDFLVPLHYWSALEHLNLSRNNFVTLPDCISKAVNLKSLQLQCCKRLREIPILPPKLESLDLNYCTSLEKIPKLPSRLKYLHLQYCVGLSGDEVAKFENNWLNQDILVSKLESEWWDEVSKAESEWWDLVSKAEINFWKKVLKLEKNEWWDEVSKWENEWWDEVSKAESEWWDLEHLSIIYPGNEVPKWFSHISNHPTTSQPIPEYEWDEDDRFVGGSEFRFEIPLKLQVGEKLLGLALSFVVEPCTYSDDESIFINGKETFVPDACCTTDIKATHVRLAIVRSSDYEQQGDICEVVFRFPKGCPIKSCGVHCLLRPASLHLSLRPTSSLGKRPRPRGSSSSEDEEQEQEQPFDSDDHPKHRQIDPNVPFDIEEDAEQEQPSDSDDPQFLIY